MVAIIFSPTVCLLSRIMIYSKCLPYHHPSDKTQNNYKIFLIQGSQPIMLKWRDLSQWLNPYRWDCEISFLLPWKIYMYEIMFNKISNLF